MTNGEKIERIANRKAFIDAFNSPYMVFDNEWWNAECKTSSWIPVNERLPEENIYVLIYTGSFSIAKLHKGISKIEREKMKNGELEDPEVYGWNSSGYCVYKRSEAYRACDEYGNNEVPYNWETDGGACIFGQYVRKWMPIPEVF